jgi:hypothetical protein
VKYRPALFPESLYLPQRNKNSPVGTFYHTETPGRFFITGLCVWHYAQAYAA